MTPSEFNLFLNTPPTVHPKSSGLTASPKINSEKVVMIILAGIAAAAIGYAVYVHLENKRLKERALGKLS
jgi:hypothetical protein